jgi:3',5'-nucleoside bisphosphate phosphatase
VTTLDKCTQADANEYVESDLKVFRLDLHIHTVLSPCTELADMTPKAIVAKAIQNGLDAIAICDHNSCRNVKGAVRAGNARNFLVIPGIEITSKEEVHIVGLFSEVAHAEAIQEEIYSRLGGFNDEEAFGYQVVVDENDFVEDMDQRLLIGATTLNTNQVVDLIHNFQGLAIAAHIDRTAFGIFSQLGFIPNDLELDALEISKHIDGPTARQRYDKIHRWHFLRSSDAHYLTDIGSAFTQMYLKNVSFKEIEFALNDCAGRRVIETDH